MADDKLLVLIQRLSDQTNQGNVKWEKTVDDGVFQASFPGYSIHILTRTSRIPQASDPDYVLEIYNDDGVLIEQADDVDFKDLGLDPPIFTTMEQMYTKARRMAMGVDRALDSLLGSLDDLDLPSI